MDITVNMYLLQFHYFNTRDLLFFLSFFFLFTQCSMHKPHLVIKIKIALSVV